MKQGTLLTAILFALFVGVAAIAQDRLDAYAKFKPLVASFEPVMISEHGREYESTSTYGVELGGVRELGKGLSFEFGFIAFPDVQLDGLQLLRNAGIEDLGSDTYIELETQAFLFDLNWNVTHSIMPKSPIQAFVGLGLGLAYIDVHQQENGNEVFFEQIEGDSNWSPAYRASAGIQFQIIPELVLTIGYSYVNFGTAKFGNRRAYHTGSLGYASVPNFELDLEAQVLQLGIKYAF